jgi:hypothetical protein
MRADRVGKAAPPSVPHYGVLTSRRSDTWQVPDAEQRAAMDIIMSYFPPDDLAELLRESTRHGKYAE